MNRREAKRAALLQLASAAREPTRAALVASLTPDDHARVRAALDEIADELERRATGERKPVAATSIHPGQLTIFEEE